MEFIRKDELKEMLHKSIEYWKNKDDCTLITLLGVVDDVNKLPTIDSETVIYPSRPKGKWVIDDTWKVELYGEYCSCSHCKEWTINGRGMDKLNFCPNCGADMKEEK